MSFEQDWKATISDCLHRWPSLEFGPDEKEAHRGAWPELVPERRAEWLLTRLALGGNPSAQQVLDAWVVQLLEVWFQRKRFPMALRADALQDVRSALFGVGEQGQLSKFAGRGPLDRWLQVVAIRRGLNTLRAAKGSQPEDLALDEVEDQELGMTFDADLLWLKREQQERFKKAFEAALQKLDDRGRLLLSMRYLHGASTEQLATLVGSHRVSVSKWLTDARQAVQREVLAQLEGDTGNWLLSGWMSSHPNLSISRLFRLPS